MPATQAVHRLDTVPYLHSFHAAECSDVSNTHEAVSAGRIDGCSRDGYGTTLGTAYDSQQTILRDEQLVLTSDACTESHVCPSFRPGFPVHATVAKCTAFSSIASTLCDARLQRSWIFPSSLTSQQALQDTGVCIEWLLRMVGLLPDHILAARASVDFVVYRGLLAMTLRAAGSIAQSLDQITSMHTKRNVLTSCTKQTAAVASKLLVAEATGCMVAGSASRRLGKTDWKRTKGRPDELEDLSDVAVAGPAKHLLSTCEGLWCLGLTNECAQLLQMATPVVLAERSSFTTGAFLKYFTRLGLQQYSVHDHYFALVVKDATAERSRTPTLLCTTEYALRSQYMPGECARQVIFEGALHAVNNGNVKVCFLKLAS